MRTQDGMGISQVLELADVGHHILRHWSFYLDKCSAASTCILNIPPIGSVRNLKVLMNTQSFTLDKVMILLKSYLASVINLLIIIPIKHATIYTQHVHLWLITLGGTFQYL